ncbi:MAG TPA: hypothetical protein VLM37_02110, partial [Fibrobacteraceae bacterium]|nr:hypothetical protein [Fibrobacteraceae bacterium]
DVSSYLEEVKGQYRIYLLGEDGSLDPQVTVAEVQYADVKEDIYLELTATVDHFSWAMVLGDTVSNGALPVIYSVTASGDSIIVKGAYGADSIQQNLELKLSSANHLADSTALLLTQSVAVDTDGTFQTSFPSSVLVSGDNWIYVKYLGSPNAAKANYYNNPADLILSGWTDAPDPFAPSCGDSLHTVSATANRAGSVYRVIRSATGSALEARIFSFSRGEVAFHWDGCLDGQTVTAGQYYHEFRDSLGDSTLQILEVSVGSVTSAEVVSIAVDHDPFQPAPNVNFQVQTVTVRARNLYADSLIVTIRKGGVSLDTLWAGLDSVDSSGNQVWTATWDGTVLGTMVDSGTYEAVAYRLGSLATPKSVSFVVGGADLPLITLALTPDTLEYPVRSAFVSVTSDSALYAKLWLETSSGALYARLLGSSTTWDSITGRNATSLPFTVTDSSLALPTQAILAWKTSSGSAGLDTLPLAWNNVSMGISVKSVTSDTVFLGVDASDLQYFGDRYATEWVMTFESDRAGVVSFVVTGPSVSQVYQDTVASGLQTWIWDGLSDTSLVEEGDYQILMYAHSSITEDSALVESYVVHVKRIPVLVISYQPDTELNPHMPSDVGESFVSLLRDSLESLGVKRMMTLDAAGAEAYMRSSSKGVVAFVNEVIDSTVHSGSTVGILHQYIQAGGKVGFFNALPLQRWGLAQTDGLKSSVTLYGYDALSQRTLLDSLSQVMFHSAQTVDSVDAGLQAELHWPFEDGTLRADTGMSVSMTSVLADLGTRYACIAYSSDTAEACMGLFVKPVWSRHDPFTSGSFLSLYPYQTDIAITDVPAKAGDYARVLYRYFLSSDLYITDNSISYTNTKTGVDSIRRGDTLRVDLTIGFMGDRTLDTVRVRLSDVTNDWVDTVELYDVSFGKTNSVNAWIPVGDSWAFDTNTIVVQVLPFHIDTTINGEPDSIVELNLANNRASFKYVIEDTLPPTVTIEDITESDSTLIQAYSGLKGSFVLEVTGTATTVHGQGTLDLSLVWVTQDGDTVMNTETSLVSAADAVIDLNLQPAASLMTHGDVDTLRIRVTDKYGNSTLVRVRVRIDQQSPSIDSLFLITSLSSELDTSSPFVQTFFMGAGTPLMYLRVSDTSGTGINAGLLGYYVTGASVELISDETFGGV